MESRQKRADKEEASKGHRRDKIENINKNTQTVETTDGEKETAGGKVFVFELSGTHELHTVVCTV